MTTPPPTASPAGPGTRLRQLIDEPGGLLLPGARRELYQELEQRYRAD